MKVRASYRRKAGSSSAQAATPATQSSPPEMTEVRGPASAATATRYGVDYEVRDNGEPIDPTRYLGAGAGE